MCPADVIVKTEASDDVVDLSSLTCGDGVGAMAEKRATGRPSALPSPPPTPSKLRIKREDPDDILADLHCLFDALDVNDSEDDNDSDSDSGSVTVPPSPRSKDLNFPPTKTYFCVRNRNYSYDEDHNVYMEDTNGNSTIVHWGEMTDGILDAFNPSFHIDGIPFHFDMAGLYYSEQGVMYRIQTWQPEMGLHPFQQELDFGFNAFGDPLTPNLSLGSAFDLQSFEQPTVTNGSFCDTTQSKPQTKAEEYINQNPLNGSLQGSVPWSPSSSTPSPIVSSTSRATSEVYEQPLIGSTLKTEYPLFQPEQPQLEPEQNLGWIAGVQLWKHETKEIQQARHAPASDKMDRRRCPECSKVFRRPSSLEDHLNVHSGNKPHICPFERCKTGFATKSNMKRHFATHRAGTLEEYAKGHKVNRQKALTATYNAKAFHTQRFRLT